MLKVAQIFVESRDKDRYEEAKRETQKVLAEYDTYIIAEVNDSQISNLKGRGFFVRERPGFRKIEVGDVEFEAEENRENLGLASFESDFEFYVLQFVGPVKNDWIEMLEKLGIVFSDYVYNNAYVVKIGFHTIQQVTSIRNMKFIRFITKYISEFKISSRLKGRKGVLPLAEFKKLQIVPASVPYDQGGNITVVLHDSVYMSETSHAIIELGGTIVVAGEDLIRVAIDPSSGSIEKIAEIKGVQWIEPYVEPTFFLDKSAKIVNADPAMWKVHNLDGTGQVIAVADTGIDTGDARLNMHADFSKIANIYNLSQLHSPLDRRRRYASDEPLGPPRAVNEGHGTHVAGIALGNGASSGGTIKGIAHGATLVFQSVMDERGGLTGLPANLEDLFLPPYDNDDARIHNNSWGSNINGLYNQRSRDVDKFVWDHRDMVIVFAAGNEGTDANPTNGVVDNDSLCAPGTAKNCITVGGSENNKRGPPAHKNPCPPNSTWGRFHNSKRTPLPRRVMNAAPISNDPWADEPEGMMAISSRGPTDDGRVKPDLVAPGSSILSTKSSLTADSGFWGVSPNNKYMFMGGTSMATPHVSGAAAIVRQYLAILMTKEEVRKKWRKKVKTWRRGGKSGGSPTAALIKALLIHGARRIKGQYPSSLQNDAEDYHPDSRGRIPNNSQGFGILDLKQSLFPPAPIAMEIFDGYRVFRDEQREYQFLVQDTVPFKATIVWTDVRLRKLVNNLNLIVHTPDGREFHGNFVAAQPPDSWKRDLNVDDKNNVEKVIIKNPASGIYRIQVKCDRLILSAPGGIGQDYALVVSADLKETLKAIIGYPDNPGKLPGNLPWWKLCNKFRPLNPKRGDGPLVKRDTRKDPVLHLQRMLADSGFGGRADGIFGDPTEKAVKDFQHKNKDWEGNPLKVDVKVGPKTCDALNKAMVGIWYDKYVTPLELTGDTLIITATRRAMRKGISVPPEPIKQIKVILKDPPTKHITLLDPYKNRFAFPDEGEYDVLDKDENSLLTGTMKSPDNIVIKNDVTPPFTVELEVDNTFYTFYGEEK